SSGVLTGFAREFLGFLRPAEVLHETLHVMSRAVQGDREQVVFGLGGRHARHSPYLRITDFAARHGGGNLRQALECMRDAHLLPSGAEFDATLEVEPM